MTLGMVAALALAVTDPCAPVVPAAAPDADAAAAYRAVAQEERAAGDREAAAVAWRLAASNDPGDDRAREELAALCREGAARPLPRDPEAEAIRLLDAGRYREAAELLRLARRQRRSSDTALLEGICRYELGDDGEAARLLREAELDATHRETARLYLGLLALRGGSATEAAALFDAAANSPSLAPIAIDLSRSARWDGPFLASLLLEGGWDSNVRLTGTQATGPGARSGSNGDAVGGLSALVLGRPLGANGPFVRAAGAYQKFARLDAYDFASWEAAAGGRWWRGGTGITGEYSYADRWLGGAKYLATHRLLATGSLSSGPFGLHATWWGRVEDYAPTWGAWSGFAQRADARVSAALGGRARLAAGWAWGRDDADAVYLGWTEQGPRADLRLVIGPRTRLSAEGGVTWRRYAGYDPVLLVRLEETNVDGVAAFEWDVAPRATVRVSLSARWSDSNYDGFDYQKVVPAAAIGVMMTP